MALQEGTGLELQTEIHNQLTDEFYYIQTIYNELLLVIPEVGKHFSYNSLIHDNAF